MDDIDNIAGYKFRDKQAKESPSHTKMTEAAAALLQWYKTIRQHMINNGIPANVAEYVALQAIHESNQFRSQVAKQNHNFTGIMYINKPYQVATKGRAKPEGGNYANYATTAAWATDMARIIKLSPGRPVDAKSIEDYAARLKQNRYYGDSQANYTKALQRWQKLYTGYKDAEYHVTKHPLDSKIPAEKPEDEITAFFKKNWKWILLFGGGAFVLSRVTR